MHRKIKVTMALQDTQDTTVLAQKLAISKQSPASFIIKDEKDGDMQITFFLEDRKEDNGSYTRYQVLSNHSANVIISNVERDKRTVLTEPMRVGTYHNNDLFLLFSLSAINNGYHEIDVRFFTKGGAQC